MKTNQLSFLFAVAIAIMGWAMYISERNDNGSLIDAYNRRDSISDALVRTWEQRAEELYRDAVKMDSVVTRLEGDLAELSVSKNKSIEEEYVPEIFINYSIERKLDSLRSISRRLSRSQDRFFRILRSDTLRQSVGSNEEL